MDDLSAMLNQVMSDPQSMKQIQNIMGSLNNNGSAPANQQSADNSQNNNAQNTQQNSTPQIDPAMLNNLMNMLNNSGAGNSANNEAQTDNSVNNALGTLANSNNNGMGNLGALAGMLSGSNQQQSSPGLGGLGGLLGSNNSVTPEMLSMVTRLAPMLSKAQQEDNSTRLLHALKPLLSEAKQKKMDEAIKILQMMRMLPLLKETGLMSSLF